MNNIKIQTAIRMLRSTAEKTGTPLPAKFVKAADALDAEAAAVGGRFDVTAQGLADAAYAAHKDGRDPALDDEVVRLVTLKTLDSAGVPGRISWDIDEQRRALLIEHADAIVDGYRDAAATAGQAIAAMAGVDLADPTVGARLPTHQLEAWAAARAGVSRLQELAGAWVHIADVTGKGGALQYRSLILTPLDADEIDSLPDRGRTPLEGVLAGHAVDLASHDGYRQRLAHISRQREQEQRAAAESVDNFGAPRPAALRMR